MNIDINFRKIPKKKAKEEIGDFILKEKGKGVRKLSTLDVVVGLKLPANQVEDVLEDFGKENGIKEIYG